MNVCCIAYHSGQGCIYTQHLLINHIAAPNATNHANVHLNFLVLGNACSLYTHGFHTGKCHESFSTFSQKTVTLSLNSGMVNLRTDPVESKDFEAYCWKSSMISRDECGHPSMSNTSPQPTEGTPSVDHTIYRRQISKLPPRPYISAS